MTDARTPPSVRDIVRAGTCIGCGACAADSPQAAMAWDESGLWKPTGPDDWYRRPSPALARRCPFSPDAANEDQLALDRFGAATHDHPQLGRFEAAYVGHVEEGEVRAHGSSGGMVSWVAAELLRTGVVDAVAHIVPASDPAADGRFFDYRLSYSPAEIAEGAKSRYYPVELSGVLRAIRETPGRYAIVAVPCFAKAIHLARRDDPVLAERITHVLGLFCGHQKSARLVDSFAWQLATPIARVRGVDYRVKDAGRPANWYRAQLTLDDGSTRAQDWWHLADGDWGAGFFQNPACDWCDDVVAETADIAFGDAWVEPYASDGRGTNVVIVRSRALHALVEQAIAAGRLALRAVDGAFIAETQAAGLRHRREGLAYRLTWGRRPPRLTKRVTPARDALPLRRRLVYRLRAAIARDSHRIARTALRLHRPAIYTRWAGTVLTLYRALAWSHGRLGSAIDRLLPPR